MANYYRLNQNFDKQHSFKIYSEPAYSCQPLRYIDLAARSLYSSTE